VEQIREGEFVLTIDLDTFALVHRRVASTIIGETESLVRLEASDSVVRCTDTHRFYVVGRGWTQAGAIEPGDQLYTADGTHIAVDSIATERLKRPVAIFNLSVDEHHYYFVGEPGFLVHNDKP
jgi:hypothetical protein